MTPAGKSAASTRTEEIVGVDTMIRGSSAIEIHGVRDYTRHDNQASHWRTRAAFRRLSASRRASFRRPLNGSCTEQFLHACEVVDRLQGRNVENGRMARRWCEVCGR